jgi:hypothetical protein
MEAWVLYAWLTGSYLNRHPPIVANPQREDTCVLAAKNFPLAMCLSELEGRVMWFREGKQVTRP